MIKLVLIDDHTLFREGLRALLAVQPDMNIVGEAAAAREGKAIVDSTDPDVVVVDLSLAGFSGISLVREIARQGARRGRPKILMLSMYDGDHYVTEALTAGAHGYALKNQSMKEILGAIRTVADGACYVAPSIPPIVVESSTQHRAQGGGAEGPLEALSEREKQVFDLMIQGLGNKEIAAQLFISVKTVETHRTHIMKKLRLHSILDVIRFALQHSLLLNQPRIFGQGQGQGQQGQSGSG
jgi:two-component system response regulator NreC